MPGLAALLIPAVLMVFALAMERMEHVLDGESVNRDQVEEFLADATSEEVGTLATDGFPAALDELRSRREPTAPSPPASRAS